MSLGGQFTNSALDTSVAAPRYIRDAYTNDGNETWVASKYANGGPGQGSFGGLEYLSNFGTSTVKTTALQGSTDWRSVQVVGGQLYGGTGSSSVRNARFLLDRHGGTDDTDPHEHAVDPVDAGQFDVGLCVHDFARHAAH